MNDPYACTICWRRLSEPIVLNCGHTFDRKCVENVKSCPICRTEILSRSTNWQLLSIIEMNRLDFPSSYDSSSDDMDLESNYILITNWTEINRGSMIRYTLNTKKSTQLYGWFVDFNLEKKIVQIQLNQGKVVRLPLEYIKEASYHPDQVKETSRYKAACCQIL